MEDPNNNTSESVGADLLFGAEAIGAEINRSKAEVYYIHRTNKLPIRNWGKILIASRRELRRAFRELTTSA
jgi:hypothetical protein